ncbi:MAG: histidine kinase dimerization/phospho-acceptor domain-containing protein, partial [Burkholderiaceae bacterium]
MKSETKRASSDNHFVNDMNTIELRDFFLKNIRVFLAWPILFVVLSALIFAGITFKIEDDKHIVDQSAMIEVASLSRAYAQHLTRTIELVDQITSLVKFEWEHSHRELKFEDLINRGLFPVSEFALVKIIDRNGLAATGTLNISKDPLVTDRDYFIFHKENTSGALRIGAPTTGRITKKTVIQFTRRLDAPDGSFDGVVLISVEPSYLSTFYDAASLGHKGLIATVGLDGKLRSFTSGGKGKVNSAQPSIQVIPSFEHDKASGWLEGSTWFSDKHERYAAWQKLQEYPLIAVVALSKEERRASYLSYWHTYKKSGVIVIVLLFFFCGTATFLTCRLSWIKYQAKEINLAYRMATEGGNDGFYMLRPIRNKSGVVKDFEIADCNEKGATFFGKKSAQFINMRTSDIFPKACFSIVNGTLCNAMETGYLEHEIQKSPDSPLQLEWAQIRLVRSGNGLAVTMRDMTQSKEDEIIRMGDLVKERTAELAQSNYRLSLVNQAQQEHQSELTRFLAVASHDLRQPMHALNLYLGALQNVELNDTAQPLLANVTKCAQIMDKMFLALLDLSRLDAQLVKPHIEHFPIDTVLTRLAVEYAPQAQANGIAFHIDHSN